MSDGSKYVQNLSTRPATELGASILLQTLFGAQAPIVRSKYDPLQDAFAAEAPTGSSKYDMVGELLATTLVSRF